MPQKKRSTKAQREANEKAALRRRVEPHPLILEVEQDLQRETQAARYWNMRYHQMVEENNQLRSIVSVCADAVGAHCDKSASLEFMNSVPTEVYLFVDKLRHKYQREHIDTNRWKNRAELAQAQNDALLKKLEAAGEEAVAKYKEQQNITAHAKGWPELDKKHLVQICIELQEQIDFLLSHKVLDEKPDDDAIGPKAASIEDALKKAVIFSASTKQKPLSESEQQAFDVANSLADWLCKAYSIDSINKSVIKSAIEVTLMNFYHFNVTAESDHKKTKSILQLSEELNESLLSNPLFKNIIEAQLQDEPAHSDDIAVDQFAALMRAKMASGRKKGRSGWDDPAQCSNEYLAKLMAHHLTKPNDGNYIDIANFAMMLSLRKAKPSELVKAINDKFDCNFDASPAPKPETPKRMAFGAPSEDFIPPELLLKPDLTEADIEEWRKSQAADAANCDPEPKFVDLRQIVGDGGEA